MQLMKDLLLTLAIETVSQSEEVALQVSIQGEAAGVKHEFTHRHKCTVESVAKCSRARTEIAKLKM